MKKMTKGKRIDYEQKRFSREGSVGFRADEGELTEESDEEQADVAARAKEGEELFTEESDDEQLGKPATKQSCSTGGISYRPESSQPQVIRLENCNSSFGKQKLYGLLAIVTIILACVVGMSGGKNESTADDGINSNRNIEDILYSKRKDEFINDLKTIRQQFPSQQDRLWHSLFQKIKYINESEPVRPAVIVLSYNSTREVAECLAWKVGTAASRFLNTPGIIELIGSGDMNEIDNELLVQYKEPLQRNAVMVVYRLNEIPALVAKSFHSICDTYNPLVRRALILFTLDNNILAEHNTINNQPSKKVCEILRSLWKGSLIDSTLNSLITRVTDTVLEVYSEDNVHCSK